MKSSNAASFLALAALSLAACAKQTPSPTAPAATTSGVRCQGINSCRGMAECTGPGHSCGKHTPCKGQGWLTVESADVCAERGGTVL